MQKITIKELAVKMNISESSAKRLMKDIKESLDIKIVTLSHINNYLKLPMAQNHSS